MNLEAVKHHISELLEAILFSRQFEFAYGGIYLKLHIIGYNALEYIHINSVNWG